MDRKEGRTGSLKSVEKDGSDVRQEFHLAFLQVYNQFKLNFYKYVFLEMEADKAPLTPLETFTLEVIYLLGRPTINALSHFLEISQPNTAYRVSSLINKGYVVKVRSQVDKREYYLELTDKFTTYYRAKNAYMEKSLATLGQVLEEEELRLLTKALKLINDEVFEEDSDSVDGSGD